MCNLLQLERFTHSVDFTHSFLINVTKLLCYFFLQNFCHNYPYLIEEYFYGEFS